MAIPQVAIFRGRGLNTDEEMQEAFRLAGAEADRILLMDWLSGRATLDRYQIVVVPGGFLDGDDVASAKVFGVQLKHRMREVLRKFFERDTLMMGVCNGFQALEKSGVLPYMDFEQRSTLTYNDSGKFEDRWVYLEVNKNSPCIFTRDCEQLYLPVRHGEGKFFASQDELDRLETNNQIALRYVDKNGLYDLSYPGNPNGSLHSIASVCDPSGRVFGLMPHPEAYIHPYQHPHWTRLKNEGRLPAEGDGMKIFINAVSYFQ